MSMRLRRSTISALAVFALLMGRESSAQPSEGVSAPADPAIEIDRAALVIDVAAERRVLEEVIRRELARRSAAKPERDPKVAASGARPHG